MIIFNINGHVLILPGCTQSMNFFTKRETSLIFHNNILLSRNFLWSCTIYEHIWKKKPLAGLLKLIALYTLQWPGIIRLSSCNSFLLRWVEIAGLGARLEWWHSSLVLSVSFVMAYREEPDWDLVCYLFALSSKTFSFLAQNATLFRWMLLNGNTACREQNVVLLYSEVRRSRTATHRTQKYCRLACVLFPSWMFNLH